MPGNRQRKHWLLRNHKSPSELCLHVCMHVIRALYPFGNASPVLRLNADLRAKEWTTISVTTGISLVQS